MNIFVFLIGILTSKQIMPTSLFSFQLMTSIKNYVEISTEFYVMFPAIMNDLEKQKMQKIKNHDINTEK